MSDCDDSFDYWDPHENYYDSANEDDYEPRFDDSDTSSRAYDEEFETLYGRRGNESAVAEEGSVTKEELEHHVHYIATGERKLKALKDLIDFSTLPVEMRLHGACLALSYNWNEGAKLFLWYVSTDTNSTSYSSRKKETNLNFESTSAYLKLTDNLMTLAVEKGEDTVLKLLLGAGANIHRKLKGPFTYIHIAVQRQHVQSVKCLLIYGADVNSRYSIDSNNLYQGSTLLHCAVEKGNMPIVRLLIDFGADINAMRSDELTPLNLAAYRGFYEIANSLIQEGANINPGPVSRFLTNDERKEVIWEEHEILRRYTIAGSDLYSYLRMKPEIVMEERTPLLSAIQNRQRKMVSFLLENGADINIEGWKGDTALQLATQSSCPQIVLDVLSYCPKLDEKNRQALYSTIQSMGTKDDHIILQKLLEYGFTLESTDKNNPNLLRYAVRGNFLEVTRQMLEFGANPNETSHEWNGFDQSPLSIAVIGGNKAMVEMLLNFGSSPNSRDEDGNTPLLYATILSESDIARLLLESGADSSNDHLIMIFATANCDVELVKLLCERGFKINERILHLRGFHFRAFHKVRLGSEFSSHNNKVEHFSNFLPKAAGKQSALDYDHQNNFYDSYEVTPLSIAARANRFDTVKLLLERGADIHSKDVNGVTALHEASQGGRIEIVKILLKCGAKINAESRKGTPLHLAIATQQWEVVEFLLKEGANYGEEGSKCIFYETVKLHAPDVIVKLLVEGHFQCNHWDFESALTHLIKQRKIDLVKLLINYRADLSSGEILGMLITCISTAIQENLEEETKYLLHYSSQKFKSGEDFEKLFLTAIRIGNLQTVTKMLDLGINANIAEQWSRFHAFEGSNYHNYCIDGYSALHIAAREGHVDILTKLLERGASINSRDERGRSAIFDASEKGHFNIVKLLVEHEYDSDYKSGIRKAALDATDEKKKTPLFKASTNGHIKIVRYLLNHGAAAEIRTVHGETPLSMATRNDHLNIVKILLKNGAIINTINKSGETPLHKAVMKGHYEIVKFLLDNGATINTKNNSGETPLHKAVTKGRYEIVKFLLDNGALTEIRDHRKNTPLLLAVQKNLLQISEELLKSKSGAKINCQNSKKVTPIHIAVKKNLSEMLNLLLKYGVNLDLQDSQLNTPLMISVESRKMECYEEGEVISLTSRRKEKIFDTLLMSGANLNLQDCDGKTVLHHASAGYNIKMIRLLLDLGANVESKDKDGKTPLFSAVEIPFTGEAPQSIETLLAAGADIDTKAANGKSLIISTLSTCDKTLSLKLLLEFDAEIDIPQAIEELQKISVWTRTYENIGVLMCHAIKMMVINKHDKLGALATTASRYMEEPEVFKNQCMLEVHQMRNECIGNTEITFFQILNSNFRQVASLVKNEEIAQHLRENELGDRFPIYASLLKTRLRMGEIRNYLLGKSVKLCSYLFCHYPTLPLELAERVLDYLSNVDLRVIIVTCEHIRISSLDTLSQSSSLDELNLFDA